MAETRKNQRKLLNLCQKIACTCKIRDQVAALHDCESVAEIVESVVSIIVFNFYFIQKFAKFWNWYFIILKIIILFFTENVDRVEELFFLRKLENVEILCVLGNLTYFFEILLYFLYFLLGLLWLYFFFFLILIFFFFLIFWKNEKVHLKLFILVIKKLIFLNPFI